MWVMRWRTGFQVPLKYRILQHLNCQCRVHHDLDLHPGPMSIVSSLYSVDCDSSLHLFMMWMRI